MIKQMVLYLKVLMSALLLTHSFVVSASSDFNVDSLLQKMRKALNENSYEMTFINANQSDYEVMRYRHGVHNNTPLAQLTYMEGPNREVLLKGDRISYYQHEMQPFSIRGEYIVDTLPTLFHVNFDDLADIYDYIHLGRARTANRNCILIRIADKERVRYNQVLWLDSDSYLPMRVDYLDHEGELIEQFKVATVTVSDDIIQLLQPIKTLEFPPLIPNLDIDNKEKVEFDWQVNWLPDGTKELSRFYSEIDSQDLLVETRLFSDKIYTFTINVIPLKNKAKEQLIMKGARAVYSETRGKHEIVIIGELPFVTAKRIIANMTF